MKILFAYKGRYHVRDSITVEYLSSLARKAGHQAYLVYDQDIFGVTDNVISFPLLQRLADSDKKIAARIVRESPDIVVFLDGFCRRAWNASVTRRVKKIQNNCITVQICYSEPESHNPDYTYILVGEPEYAFEKFLQEKLFASEKGTYAFKGLMEPDALPFPDKTLFSPYINFSDSYLVYTSKGCPYACSYCEETICKNEFGAGYVRRRSPAHVLAELAWAKKTFDFREVIYKDSVFTSDKTWLNNYLDEYAARIGTPYKCFAKAESFDDDVARALKRSGCYCVEFGVQTFNEKIKKEILNRGERNETLREAFAVCARHALPFDADHLFGIPGETVRDYLAAAEIYARLPGLNRIKCHHLTFYREAPIYEQAPSAIKNDPGYCADFFSPALCQGTPRQARAFKKYFKTLPLLPRWLNRLAIKKGFWRIFYFVPGPCIMMLMIIQAIKNRDTRFWIYARYYPKKLKHLLFFYRGQTSKLKTN